MAEEPKLVRRREHRKSTIVSGRTIGEAREKLETKNERVAARKKDKRKKALRVSFTTIGFAILSVILIVISVSFISSSKTEPTEVVEENIEYPPTIKIIDEDASSGGQITSRMSTYIGEAEADFKALGLKPVKAVIPSGSIRIVHFYLDGYTGYIKFTIDRGSAVSVEDADRLIRYLAGQGINDFEYLDVRLAGRAYWK